MATAEEVLIEQLAKRVFIEQLAKRVGELTCELEAKEAAIKEINSQVELAEQAAHKKIAKTKEDCAATCAALRTEIGPLLELRDQTRQLSAGLAQAKEIHRDEVTKMQHIHQMTLKETEQAAAAAHRRLESILAEIATVKATVAGL